MYTWRLLISPFQAAYLSSLQPLVIHRPSAIGPTDIDTFRPYWTDRERYAIHRIGEPVYAEHSSFASQDCKSWAAKSCRVSIKCVWVKGREHWVIGRSTSTGNHAVPDPMARTRVPPPASLPASVVHVRIARGASATIARTDVYNLRSHVHTFGTQIVLNCLVTTIKPLTHATSTSTKTSIVSDPSGHTHPEPDCDPDVSDPDWLPDDPEPLEPDPLDPDPLDPDEPDEPDDPLEPLDPESEPEPMICDA